MPLRAASEKEREKKLRFVRPAGKPVSQAPSKGRPVRSTLGGHYMGGGSSFISLRFIAIENNVKRKWKKYY